MMWRFDVQDLARDYGRLVQRIIEEGEPVAPRGAATFELRDVGLVFKDARSATFPVGIGRGVSKHLMAAELCQWAGGVSDLKQLRSVSNDRFSLYSDDGIRLHGAYGPRAFKGLSRAVDVLMNDKLSRQAVVPLWGFDEPLETKDLPCTVSWSFALRNGKLHMTTFMRSNDVWTGVAYDIPIMARLQSAVAWALGVEVGEYTHFAQSLHLYHSDLEAVSGLHDPDGRGAVDDAPFFDQMETAPVAWDARERWTWLAKQFVAVTRGSYLGPKELTYYANHLDMTSRYDHFCETCRYFLPQRELFCA